MWTACRCGSPQHDDNFAVRFSSTELLTSTTHAESAIWWHLSTAGDVFVNARNDPMHWGELDTVLHYYATESLMPAWSTSRRPRYLYAANLSTDVTVNPTAFVENQSADEHVEILAAAASQGPTRYLNTREVPGSVSLVVLKTDLRPIHCIDLWNQVNSSGIMLPPRPPKEA